MTVARPRPALAAAPGALNLPVLWEEASRRFLHLITLLPEVLEAYQCEDAAGSTVRRWAVLSDEATVMVDASVAPRAAAAASSAPPAAATERSAAEPPGAVARSKRQQQQGQRQPAKRSGELPQALLRELDFLRRRYGSRQLPVEAAAAQLAALDLSVAGSGAAPAAPGTAVAFELALQPTDPAWQPISHPPQLLLQGWVTGAYPEPGSLQVAISPQQPQLGQLPREVLDKLLAAEVSTALSAGGRGSAASGALSAVVRHVANHAGRLWEQAEDIAAEVARRRQLQAAQQAQQQSPASPSPSSAPLSEVDDDGAYAGSSDWSSSSSGDGGNSWSDEESDGEDGERETPGSDSGPGERGSGRAGAGHSDATLPLQFQLEGLELVDCDCLELLRLNLQVGGWVGGGERRGPEQGAAGLGAHAGRGGGGLRHCRPNVSCSWCSADQAAGGRRRWHCAWRAAHPRVCSRPYFLPSPPNHRCPVAAVAPPGSCLLPPRPWRLHRKRRGRPAARPRGGAARWPPPASAPPATPPGLWSLRQSWCTSAPTCSHTCGQMAAPRWTCSHPCWRGSAASAPAARRSGRWRWGGGTSARAARATPPCASR